MSFTHVKESDNYATDKNGWEMIKDYIPQDKKIWAPFYCDGKQKEIFKEMGYDIIHKDEDFFENIYPEADLICDNPPFANIKKVCERLEYIGKPFILIMPARTLQLKHFLNRFKDDLQIIVPSSRPTFTHLTNPKKGYTPPFGTMYFCWKMKLEKDLTFL
jgi:hypothetical protein